MFPSSIRYCFQLLGAQKPECGSEMRYFFNLLREQYCKLCLKMVSSMLLRPAESSDDQVALTSDIVPSAAQLRRFGRLGLECVEILQMFPALIRKFDEIR